MDLSLSDLSLLCRLPLLSAYIPVLAVESNAPQVWYFRSAAPKEGFRLVAIGSTVLVQREDSRDRYGHRILAGKLVVESARYSAYPGYVVLYGASTAGQYTGRVILYMPIVLTSLSIGWRVVQQMRRLRCSVIEEEEGNEADVARYSAIECNEEGN